MNQYPDFKLIRAELESSGFRFTRRWGQNFLTERKLLAAIIKEGEISATDLIVEIGTGPGCLTFPLLAAGAQVVGIEIDKHLHEIGTRILRRETPEEAQNRMTWIHGDFLADKNRIDPEIECAIRKKLEAGPARAIKIISNLPYCIATPAIMNLLESELPWSLMVVTVQEEVADRLSALPGTPAYGAVRVLVEALSDVRVVRKLPAAVFWPRPKVDSCVLKIEPRSDLFERESVSYREFKEFTRRIFAHRRKTWFKSLKTASSKAQRPDIEKVLARHEFEPGQRAEALSLDKIYRLAQKFVFLSRGGEIDGGSE